LCPHYKQLVALFVGNHVIGSDHFVIALWRAKAAESARVKRQWEIIADRLSKAGWGWGCVASLNSEGRTIHVADAHRDNGKRFVVRADEKLAALWNLY
jgi:hypothetical protein